MNVTNVTFNSRNGDVLSLTYTGLGDRLPGSQDAVTVDIKLNVVTIYFALHSHARFSIFFKKTKKISVYGDHERQDQQLSSIDYTPFHCSQKYDCPLVNTTCYRI